MSMSSVSEPGIVHGPGAGTVRGSLARKFVGSTLGIFRGRSTQPPAFSLNTNDWNALAAQALREHQDRHGLSDKEMARKIGANDRTYENYKSGKTAPSSVHLLRSISVIPELEAVVTEVCALEREIDPRAAQAMSEMYTAAMKFAEARFGGGAE